MLEIILILITIISLTYLFGVRPLNYWKNRNVKQGNPNWFGGDSWRTFFKMESNSHLITRLYKQAGDKRYFGVYQFTRPTLLIKDTELIKQICTTDFGHFLDHGTNNIPHEADPLWGNCLFALKGQKWRNKRPIIIPAFSASKMKYSVGLILETAKNLIKFLKSKNVDLVEVDLVDLFTRVGNDIMGSTVFDVRINSLENPDNEFYRMGVDATTLSKVRSKICIGGHLVFPNLFKFLKVPFYSSQVSDFFTALIEKNIKTRIERGIVKPDIINSMLKSKKLDHNSSATENSEKPNIQIGELTKDVTGQALLFLLAGFDAISSILCFTAAELAINPDIQTRLRKDIQKIFNECNGEITYETVAQMKYLEMVLSETLRKYPNTQIGDRMCSKPYTIEPRSSDEKPVHLEKGTMIWIPTFAIHRDPNIYPDPDRFDPERFSDENKEKIKPYQYLPFGMGPRMCIGNRFSMMEMKIIMFYLLLNFEIVPTAKSRIPLKISREKAGISVEGGFCFGLKRL